MAIANSDGSIILSTRVDTSGIKKGVKESEANLKSLTTTVSKLGAAIAAAFSIRVLTNFAKESINLASDLQEVQNVVDTAFGDMSYKIEDFSKTAIEKFGLSELPAKQWASTMMAMGSGMGQAMGVGSDMAVELTGRLADVMSFYNKTEEEAFTLGKAIYSGETEPLKSIGIIMTENNLALFAMSKGYQQAYKDMDASNKLLVRQQFFLEQTSLAAGDYAKTSDGWANQTRTLSQRWKEMQTVFGETFIALGVLVLPAINAIIDGLNQIAIMLRATAASFGLFNEEAKSSENLTKKTTEQSEDTAGNIEEQADAQKDLNKEMKKTLAGFDDIQILSANTAENTIDGLDSELQGIGGDLGGVAPDGSAYVDEVGETLTAIMGIVALSLAAVGLILLFTGNIGWGVGFIIAGASTLAVTMATASEFGYDGIIQMLTMIMGIAGGALLALGIILLWIGGVVGKPVAIGMIIAGAALIVGAVAAQAAFAPEDIGAWLSTILGIAGGSLLALGIILCMVGSVPVGVGMIIAGSVALVSAVALNFDSVKNSITGWVAGIMAIVGGSLLVIGIILCATGVALPLGIALIAAGAAALVTPIALNWNTIVDWVRNAWEAVKNFWNTYIAPVFTAEWWLNLGKTCINGLIAGFEGGINGIIWAFESMINWVVDGLNKISFEFPDWVPGIGGERFGVNIPRASFGRVSIPRLAQGAVLPPNKPFLSIVGDQKRGTNVEAPLSTIQEAVSAVVDAQNDAMQRTLEQILEAILGIEIGDEVIGRASQRYNNSMIKMYGG